MSTKIVLIRHAVTEDNMKGKFLGKSDTNLSDLGFEQSKRLSERLNNEIDLDLVVSSNMKRTIQTAQCIADPIKIPVHTSDKLIEVDFGNWEGLTHEEVASKDSRRFLEWSSKQRLSKINGGELVKEVQKRLIKEINNIVRMNNNKTIGIVSHAVCIKALMCYYSGYSLNDIDKVSWCENTGINIIEFNHNEVNIKSTADSIHLDKYLRPKTYSDFPELNRIAQKNSEKILSMAQ